MTEAQEHEQQAGAAAADKGKGKATEPSHDASMDEDDESSDEESGAEEQVRCSQTYLSRSRVSLTFRGQAGEGKTMPTANIQHNTYSD